MKYIRILLLFGAMIFVLSCYKSSTRDFDPRILNEGTAWKMPFPLKVSDFYYDIENIYQYEGRHQEYPLKIKSFFWQSEYNKNYTIEGAFFIVKRFATGGSSSYEFQYRRYSTLSDGEKPPDGEIFSDAIRKFWEGSSVYIQRGSTLYLTNSNERFEFGMPTRQGWPCTDGLYEKFDYSMYLEKYSPILKNILEATEFRFYFPSENTKTNGFELEPRELELIKEEGNLKEMENNSFSLSKEELEKLKKDLPILMRQEKKEPSEYIEQMRREILK